MVSWSSNSRLVSRGELPSISSRCSPWDGGRMLASFCSCPDISNGPRMLHGNKNRKHRAHVTGSLASLVALWASLVKSVHGQRAILCK